MARWPPAAMPRLARPRGDPAGAFLVNFNHRFRISAITFLAFQVLFFVVAPFVEDLPRGGFVDGSLLTLVLISGVFAVARSRRILAVAAALVIPAIVARWIHEIRPALLPQYVYLVPGLAYIIFLIGNLLHFILRAPRVNTEVLCAGVSSYLLLGTSWTLAYLLLAEFNPTAFAFTVGSGSTAVMSGFTAYYFSFITLTTVGYGDIAPLSHVARMLATMEATTGTLFVAVLIARLVALYSTQPTTPAEGNRPNDR